MDISNGPANVSWYDLGPRPGQKGSAVIAGHNGIRKNGDISVFHDLNMLRKGDIVSIKNDTGEIIFFVVRESKIYKKNANTTDVFTSNDEKSHLNLITCIFDPISKTYPNRLVVFTDKILK
jgi:LPXTG-site transpeptidase (sortase) family protein